MNAELAAAWLKLESLAHPQGVTSLRFAPAAPIDLFVGIENPGAVRTLIAEAPRASFRPRRWTSCAGFSAHRAPARTAGHDMLIVRLSDPNAADIFTALAADVIAVATSGKAADVLDRIAGRLERWQRFLEQRGTSELATNEQCGLYGELWFIENVLIPRAGPAAAVDAWVGPAARNQDFQLPRVCVELKASHASAKDEVRINNVRQLDDSGLQALFLVHLRLESRQASGDMLPRIIDRIRLSLGDHVSAFNERLIDAGYLDAHRSLYEVCGYVLMQRRNFRVHGDFPRVKESHLLPGVTDVSYSISLAACSPYAIDDEELQASMEVQ